ncbi:MAG: glycerate kinase [Rubricoccaceae bacterium]
MSARAAHARALYDAAVMAVQPARLLTPARLAEALAGDGGRLRALAVGKAAHGLASALTLALQELGGMCLAEGLVVAPAEAPRHAPPRQAEPRRWTEQPGAHPVPDARSVAAGQAALALARRAAAERTPLLVLLSGGASALMELPAGTLTLADLEATTRALLASGAPIAEVNAVRKHLSALKGGRLARAAAPARVVTLALSDVVGDDLATIGSGPTVPDPTTFADALAVLERYRLCLALPPAVRAHLEAGARGLADESPEALPHACASLLGSNADALAAAAAEARRLGYVPVVRSRTLTGEARAVGRRLAQEATAAPDARACLLWGGETTVTLRGGGRGGRNQEAALAAALALEAGAGTATLLVAGTDGVDGPTEAAGAVVSEGTAPALRACGLDPDGALERNDSHTLFAEAEARGLPPLLLRPGPTGTNVMDLAVALA